MSTREGNLVWEDEPKKFLTTALIEESLRLQRGDPRGDKWYGPSIAFIHAVLPFVAVYEARGVFDIEMLDLTSLDQFVSSDLDSPLLTPIREFLLKVPGYRLAADRDGGAIHATAFDQFLLQIAHIECLKRLQPEEAHV